MPSEGEFQDLVHDALARLHDLPYLEAHALARRFWPEEPGSGPRRGQRLHRLLLEGIEGLNPPNARERPDDARRYLILVRRYIDGAEPAEVAREMAYSRRQFFRQQRRAVSLLADLLWHKLPEAQPHVARNGDLLAEEAEPVLAQREPVAPLELAQGVLQAVQPLAANRGVAITADLPPNLPPLSGNRTLLRQALLQTLSDRVQEAGTRSLHLIVRPAQERVVVEIRRHGTAPEPAVAPSAALTSARRLVEMMGGRWRGPEAEAGGDVCRLELPVEKPRLLLAVEDNEAVIRAFRRYLSGYGYEVAGASSLAEALRLAHELKPSAITLDIMIPSQDGWEVLQALRNDAATQAIPVLICSVLDDPELARSLGAAGSLRKPVSQSDLLCALERLALTQR